MNDSDKIFQSDETTEPGLAPTAITRDGDTAIEIRWNDEALTRWTVAQLRKACPCATCREKKRASEEESAKSIGLPVLSAAEAQPLRIESMRPVGTYAYNIAFSDGHASGIFTFAVLRRTAKPNK